MYLIIFMHKYFFFFLIKFGKQKEFANWVDQSVQHQSQSLHSISSVKG